MPSPVSIRLDPDVHATLQAAAEARGVGLSTYLRELAAEEARRVKRARIREQSAAVARAVADSPAARAFYDEWGTPGAPVGPQ